MFAEKASQNLWSGRVPMGKDVVQIWREPDRKAVGQGHRGDLLEIWCGGPRDGIMRRIWGRRSKGPQAWERGEGSQLEGDNGVFAKDVIFDTERAVPNVPQHFASYREACFKRGDFHGDSPKSYLITRSNALDRLWSTAQHTNSHYHGRFLQISISLTLIRKGFCW